MITYCVYMHKNKKNGKAYIGMCKESTVYKRWASGHGYYEQKQFGDEIKNFGWDAFEHLFLYKNLTLEEAEQKEIECIEKYETRNPEKGYNISRGGLKFFLGLHHSEKSKFAISEKLKTYEKTQEHRKHISEHKQGVLHHMAKPVYQFQKDGKFVREWEYMSKAAKELKIQKTNISACCLKKVPSAGGYIWRYERSV